MTPDDRERYEKIVGALRGVGVKDFLILGLRKTPECKADQLEGFSVFTTTMDVTVFVATLRGILQDDQKTISLLRKIIEQKAQDQEAVFDLISYQGGTA